ncbi:hypothetical protein [Noviherbaspirillum sp. Root189]|uniref:hypothetical protein n=1 Tax=Noviherbaspirillum sp. Root189 TaxID=1736487 RepID=UPI00070EB8A5|nr:hypothetical protein [Noviherbaspirillum sp. Root189]KRB84809.1 hypothetical protein ASE07_22265 [Noviherbaspirillum sp. Root189]
MTKIDSLLSGLRNNGYAYAADYIEVLQAEIKFRQEAEKTLAARYQEALGEQAALQEQLAVLQHQNADARAAVNALISAKPYERTNARHALEDPETALYHLRKLLADENYAASFEDTASYREALLQFIPDPE